MGAEGPGRGPRVSLGRRGRGPVDDSCEFAEGTGAMWAAAPCMGPVCEFIQRAEKGYCMLRKPECSEQVRSALSRRENVRKNRRWTSMRQCERTRRLQQPRQG
jgi:hypothetical protein